MEVCSRSRSSRVSRSSDRGTRKDRGAHSRSGSSRGQSRRSRSRSASRSRSSSRERRRRDSSRSLSSRVQLRRDRIAFVLAHCLGKTGRGPRTATGLAGIALGMTGRDHLFATGLDGSIRNLLLVREVDVTARDHAIPLAALVTVRGHGCGHLFPLTVHGRRIKAGEPDVSNGRVWRQ